MSDNVRKVVILSSDQWAEIAQWRWDNRINTESDSIRNLLAAGLHYYKLMQDEGFAHAEAAAAERLQPSQE